ncbi:EAL domain-containing protein [Pelomonas sp. KK5]|uniref:GGDEF/EAL domain-containing response regulator n=1 Tax=Pelomonas sp. KK5 TaxID=1855730 RepID=UPI00097C7FFC|nr:EAL domain-containing protein [Pelomonas sp. KK5]
MHEKNSPADPAAGDDDVLDFLDLDEDEEGAASATQANLRPWRILVVDDDADVHRATELAMQGLKIENQPLHFLHASSAAEAREMLATEPDLACALLDVVMESDDAGLRLVRFIRDELGISSLRIVLRTGQPGYAPEIETVQAYDINDYKTKSDLTRTRLYTVLTAAVRSYMQIRALEANRQGLESIISASTELTQLRGVQRFAEGVLSQLCALLDVPPEGLVCAQFASELDTETRIIAAAGSVAGLMDSALDAIPSDAVRERLQRCINLRQSLYEDGGCTLYFGMSNGRAMVAMIDLGRPLTDLDQQLLRVFCGHIAVGFENVVLYSQLLDQAYNDQLLRLPNRNRFVELLDRNLKDPSGITLALIDIDDFSDINDAFGHRFGDQVLRSVAMRLGELLGLNTAMARVGPDAFGLLGPQEQVNGDEIQRVFVEPFAVAGERLQLSATSGLVRLSESSAVGSELLLDAQIALKRAKLQHRGSSQYFSSAMGSDARERFKLLKGLRTGFETNELFVVYQPQVDLPTNKAIGAEALIRWRMADGKFVPPDQFIPLAEQSGLIIAIGEYVLRTSCLQLRRMLELGHADFRMCVNISLAQFRHPDFIPSLNRALRDTGVDGKNLELEITESMAMEDTELVLRLLADIKRCGATVAIDDFGTGFSSLSHLRQLDVDRLKIDRAFVREAQSSAAGATIAQMVINLGRGLGLRVIAEGIETEDQRLHLLTLGCHEGQGYLFARPMQADQLERWMEAGAPAASA